MASSGSFNTSGYSGRYLVFSWNVASQDIANNRTVINWALKGAGGSTTSWYKSGNFKVLINGQQVYYSSARINLYNGTTVATGSYTINHNNDGTASFGAYAEAGIYTVAVNCTGSGSWALPTIARASQPSINTYPNNSPDFNIGDTITIHMNRASNSFTHTVVFNYGSTSVTVATGVTNNCTFDTSTIANALYALVPNANVYSNTISVTTYNGSTNIGTKTCAYNAKVVNANPTFNAAYLDTNSAVTAVTTNNQLIVRNKSTLRINISSAAAQKSATLASASCVILGQTVSATLSGSSVALNVGTINTSQDTTAAVTVTDSRGNTTTKNLTINVADWQAPTAIITLQRHNNYYSETDVTVDANYSSVDNKNAITIKVRSQKQGESSWSAYSTLQDNVTSVLTLDNEYAWNIQVLLTDSLGGSTTYNLTLSRGMPIVYFDRTKSSTGFNCFPQNDQSVEIDGDLFINGDNVMNRILGYGQVAQEITGDWDTACGTRSGFYRGRNLSNSPSGSTVDGWWIVQHIAHDTLYQRQIAHSYLDTSMYTRIMNNGTWSAWQAVLTAQDRQSGTFATVNFSAGTWSPTTVGGAITVSGLVPNAIYKITLHCQYTDGMNGEARLNCTGASAVALRTYTKSTAGLYGFTITGSAAASSTGTITIQRAYLGDAVSSGRYGDCQWFIERLN